MSTNFTPLPQEVIARDDLTPRAKFLAWCATQPPDGVPVCRASKLLGVSQDALARAWRGERVRVETVLRLGQATGFWGWGVEDEEMRRRVVCARQMVGLQGGSGS